MNQLENRINRRHGLIDCSVDIPIELSYFAGTVSGIMGCDG
jgi:hypothetical protein